jgi:hypothetical protein
MDDIRRGIDNITGSIVKLRNKPRPLTNEEILVNDIKNCLDFFWGFGGLEKTLEIVAREDLEEGIEAEKLTSELYELERVDITRTHILTRATEKNGAFEQISYEYWGESGDIIEALEIDKSNIAEDDGEFLKMKKTTIQFQEYQTINFNPIKDEGDCIEKLNYHLIITHDNFYFSYGKYEIYFKIDPRAFDIRENVNYLRDIYPALKVTETIRKYGL